MNTSNSSHPLQATIKHEESDIAIHENREESAVQIGDIFTSSVSLEKAHIDEGYQDGYKDGLVRGKQDGYEVGLKHGFQVGEELGFYRGIVDVWTAAIRVDPSYFSARVGKIIQQMSNLLEKYPYLDPEDESADEMMDGLRLKFRMVSATLGVKLEYDGYPKKSGDQDMGF